MLRPKQLWFALGLANESIQIQARGEIQAGYVNHRVILREVVENVPLGFILECEEATERHG